ncbi:MAG: hypothetical protein HOV78_02620 [Hamadaea sp.]|nr:hypothetical protein [Hamadaea sp.]
MSKSDIAAGGQNPDDVAAVDAAEAAEKQAETNCKAVTTAATDAMATLATIVASDDATISANAPGHIRTLARVCRLLLRLQLRRFEGTT